MSISAGLTMFLAVYAGVDLAIVTVSWAGPLTGEGSRSSRRTHAALIGIALLILVAIHLRIG